MVPAVAVPVIDWAAAGLTPTLLFEQVQANAAQAVVLGIAFIGLSLGLKYFKKIKRTVTSL